MGTVIVGIIILAFVLNGIRMFRKQMKCIKGWKCTGNCDSCNVPCQAKRIYHRDSSD